MDDGFIRKLDFKENDGKGKLGMIAIAALVAIYILGAAITVFILAWGGENFRNDETKAIVGLWPFSWVCFLVIFFTIVPAVWFLKRVASFASNLSEQRKERSNNVDSDY